jgi:hypothetical protein
MSAKRSMGACLAVLRGITSASGEWCVFEGAQTLAGPFEMNAEAWRWLDRYEGSRVSRSEDVGEWMFRAFSA